MKESILILACWLWLPASLAAAQGVEPYLSSRQAPVRVSISGLYQSYQDDEMDISQLSFPVSVTVPFGGGLSAGLVLSPATTSGPDLAEVGGLGDAQVGLSYYRRLGSASLGLGLGANLPSGQRELSDEEFTTYVLLSQTYYGFQAPSLGQGLNLSPSLTVAFPLSENVAVGLGALYQVRGAYRPLAAREADYDPGDEVMVTGGLDVRVARQSSISADVSYTLYGTDTQGEAEVFGAGSKTTATLQWRSTFGFDVLRLLARYRTKARNEVLAGDGTLVSEDVRAVPNQVILSAFYSKRLATAFSLGLQTQFRYFEATSVFEEQTVVRLGLLPVVRLSPNLSLQLRGAYVLGTLTGFEAGAGMSAQF